MKAGPTTSWNPKPPNRWLSKLRSPSVGTLNSRCRTIIRTQKGTLILTTTQILNPEPGMGQGVFFFVVAPFCSCPASLVSRKFFAVGPGCAKCFSFLLRSVGRRDLSAGPEQKKKTPPRVFFFFLLRPRGKAREGEAPLGAGTGPEQKKNTTQGVFFLLRPRRKAREGEAPLGAGTGPEQKKNTTQGVFFFCSGPGERQGKEKPRWAPARGQSKKKKQHPRWCFFFALAPCRRPTGLLLPLPFAGAAAKKNTLGGVFFLLRPRADAHSLTAGLGGDASPSPGWCFCCGPARTGVVFSFLLWPRPDAHSLTVGWGDFGKARVVFFFFLLRPRRVFLDNNNKMSGVLHRV